MPVAVKKLRNRNFFNIVYTGIQLCPVILEHPVYVEDTKAVLYLQPSQDLSCIRGSSPCIYAKIQPCKSQFVSGQNLTGLTAHPRLSLPIGLLTIWLLLRQQHSNYF